MENYLLQFDAINSMDTDYRIYEMARVVECINQGVECVRYDRGFYAAPPLTARRFDSAEAAIECAKNQVFQYGFVILQADKVIARYHRNILGEYVPL